MRITLAPPASPACSAIQPGVPAHDLHDQRTVVALRGGVQPVDRLHGDVHRGVEAEGVVGGAEVVVDRLGYPDYGDALLAQPGGYAQGVLTANGDERVDAKTGEVVLDPLDAVAAAVAVLFSGLVRDDPRIVPPRGRMPRTAWTSRGTVSPSSGPRHPSRNPTNSRPYSSTPLRTTARITAFRPGQSPPPVRTPTRMAPTLVARRAAWMAAARPYGNLIRSGFTSPGYRRRRSLYPASPALRRSRPWPRGRPRRRTPGRKASRSPA